MNILVIGENGQLGYELLRTLAPVGKVVATDYPYVNLAEAESIRKCVRSSGADLVVNAAAYTDVDKAEQEQALACKVNSEAVRVIGEAAMDIGAAVIHYSTDYVFDGTQQEPYSEDDRPRPLNWYGWTKLQGELQLAQTGAAYLILRTSWLYATRGRNFLLTILRLAEQHDELRIVADQAGAPTWARMVAQATANIVTALHGSMWDVSRVHEYSGTYHLTAAGSTTWADFARAILAESDKNSEVPSLRPIVTDITTREYASAAVRPRWSILSNIKVARTFGIMLPNWREQLSLALA